jgi:uncharacterized protein (UPF0335 family)
MNKTTISISTGKGEELLRPMPIDEFVKKTDAAIAAIKTAKVLDAGTVNTRLLSFVERVERIKEEQVALAQDMKELFAEIKSTGFDGKTVKAIVRDRAKDRQKLMEEQALYHSYARAVALPTQGDLF